MEAEDFKQNMQEVITIAPPLIEKQQTVRFLRSLISFFGQRPFNLQISTDYDKYNKKPTPPEKKKFKQNVTNPIRFLTTGKDCLVFDYLEKHPEVCPVATSFASAHQFCAILKPFAISSFISFTLCSECTELLEYALFKIPKPKKEKKQDRIPQAIVQIRSPETKSYFETNFNKDKIVNKSEFNIRLLSCPTSFAADMQCVYIGQINSMIKVIPFPNKKLSIFPYTIFVSLPPDEPFSLVIANSKLYVINEDWVQIINPITFNFTSIQNTSQILQPPVCSDMHYIYSYKPSQKTVHIFEPNGLIIDHIHSIKLNTTVSIGDCPMVTDGTTIAFYWKSKIYTFSLATGYQIGERSSDIDFKCWTINPFLQRYAFLTDSECISSECHEYLCPWIKGTLFPLQNNSIVESLLICNFHHQPRFTSGEPNFAFSILQKFILEKNERGISMILDTLLWMPSLLNQVVTTLDAAFIEFSDNLKNQAVYFYCLASLNGANVSAVYIIENYLSTHPSPYMIYVFPTFFDLTKINVTPKAVNRMMSFVIDTWDFYPTTSMYFIFNFMKRYFENSTPNEFNLVWESFKRIMTTIIHNVNDIIKFPKQMPVFYSSSSMRAWNEVLLFIFSHKKMWSNYSSILVDVLSFSIVPPKTTDEIITGMIQRTFYLLICIAFCQPIVKPFDSFTPEKFYNDFPSIFDKRNPEIDQRICDLINKIYDYKDDKTLALLFHRVRHFLSFNPTSIRFLSPNKLDQQVNFLGDGLIPYLKDGKVQNLQLYSNPNLLSLFISKFSEDVTVLSPHHQLIVSILEKQINRNKNNLLNLQKKIFSKFMDLFVYPFFLDSEILQKFDYKLEAPEILIYPPEIFDYFRYKKVTNISFLTSVEHLVNPFIEPLLLHDYSVFTSPENESLLFKNVYLALIAVSTGYNFEVEKLTVLFKSFILFGSPRIVDTLLKLADITMKENESTTAFIKFLIMIVDEYFEKISTRFVYKQNTIQTVFTIISFLKRMFNKFSSIREFMLQTAALHPIVTFAVLNNSLECLREGVTFKCTSSSFTGVEGKIKSFDEIENRAVAIVDDKEYEIDIDNCEDLFVNCEVEVNLELISDISNLIYLFNYQHNEEYKDIFRLASILEFVKTEKFTSQISQHVNLEFLKNCFSEGFIHSQSFQNFFSSFSLAATCKNDFGFSSTSKLTEYPSKKGIFIVNNGSSIFTSSAIYPRAKFEMILETPKSSKSKSQVSINIYAESDVPKALLTWSKSIKLGPEERFTIKTVPDQLLLDVNSTMISISPSVSKIFIVFTLSEGATLKYDVIVDSKIFKVSQKMSGNILRYSPNHPGVIPPLQKMFLLAKSCETSSQISFRIKQKILSLLYLAGLHPLRTEEIISIIPIANPYPLESSIIDFGLQSGFEALPNEFFKKILNDLYFDDFFEKFKQFSFKSSSIKPTNSAVMFLNETDNYQCPNSFILTSDTLKFTKLKSDKLKIEKESIIIPRNAFHGTFLDILIISKHLLIKSIVARKLPEVLKFIKKNMEIKPPIYKKLKSKGRIFLPWYPIQESDIHECFEKSSDKSELLKQITTWKTFHNYELFYAPDLLLSSFSKEIVELAKKNIKKKPAFYNSKGNSNLYNEEISYPSLERINFLIENKLDYFTVIDKMSCELKEDLGVQIENFKFESNVTMNLFQEFIKNETKFTVSLLFYVSKSEVDDVVYVYDSKEPESIQNNRDESYLIFGVFEDYNSFKSSLYKFIQKKLELLFV